MLHFDSALLWGSWRRRRDPGCIPPSALSQILTAAAVPLVPYTVSHLLGLLCTPSYNLSCVPYVPYACRAARTGRNPSTGAPLEIAAKDAPAFSAGTVFKGVVQTGSWEEYDKLVLANKEAKKKK